jgi:hypothetical protein
MIGSCESHWMVLPTALVPCCEIIHWVHPCHYLSAKESFLRHLADIDSQYVGQLQSAPAH